MKTTKNTNKKFNLEKFEVAKLQNPKLIRGGQAGDLPETGGVLTTTGVQDQGTSRNCLQG